MDTGPKAKGKASNPAKLQLQVRAKLRAGLISASPAGARRIPGGRRTCPELSLSTRRFLGCLEGLRKSSSAMAGHSCGLGAHRTRPQSAWLCQHNQHELVWKQKYKFLFTKYRIKQYIQGMAAFKTIHNHVDFRSLPLVVVPPFFFLFETGKFLPMTKFLGAVPKRVFGPRDCIYCVCLSQMKLWPRGWLWALDGVKFLSN